VAYLDETLLAGQVSASLNLPISAQQLGRTEAVAIRIVGFHRPSGFAVHVRSGLQMVWADLVWDSFAQPLLESISNATPDRWAQLDQTRLSLIEAGVSMTMTVNGGEIDTGESFTPESEVTRFSLHAQTLRWRGTLLASAADVAIATLSMIVSVLPLDLATEPDERGEPVPSRDAATEGAVSIRSVKHYERSRANRAVAIMIHGSRCSVCLLDFGERYGELGEGFIEVHHLLPVHLMGGAGVVNPSTDLVPLCSNCHRMAHRADPPLTPERLRESLREPEVS